MIAPRMNPLRVRIGAVMGGCANLLRSPPRRAASAPDEGLRHLGDKVEGVAPQERRLPLQKEEPHAHREERSRSVKVPGLAPECRQLDGLRVGLRAGQEPADLCHAIIHSMRKRNKRGSRRDCSG